MADPKDLEISRLKAVVDKQKKMLDKSYDLAKKLVDSEAENERLKETLAFDTEKMNGQQRVIEQQKKACERKDGLLMKFYNLLFEARILSGRASDKDWRLFKEVGAELSKRFNFVHKKDGTAAWKIKKELSEG